jgi:L-fucono-1,5-lactonase
MRIDAHQHFWQWSKGWFSRPESVLSRDYLPVDLEPLLTARGINRTIVVQTSPTAAETDFLMQLAETSGFIAGVVGWLDLEAPDFREKLELYCRNRYFVGLRPMLESLPDDWILRPKVLDSLSLIADAELTFDFLTLPRQLASVVFILDKVPRLHAVIDHLAKPDIKGGRMQPWRDLMREVALRPNVCCKLSGIITEADPKNWTREQLRPYADYVMEHFGAERVIFGSDWPVCLLAASYDEVLSLARDFVVSALGTSAEQAVFGENAVRSYRLDKHLNQTAMSG